MTVAEATGLLLPLVLELSLDPPESEFESPDELSDELLESEFESPDELPESEFEPSDEAPESEPAEESPVANAPECSEALYPGGLITPGV